MLFFPTVTYLCHPALLSTLLLLALTYLLTCLLTYLLIYLLLFLLRQPKQPNYRTLRIEFSSFLTDVCGENKQTSRDNSFNADFNILSSFA